ncbi:beta-lactamase domain protein [Caldicellulosiruptor hydrothermalis 108]|uniref:Beta-lactamase domain protein n=1 Tax=Caldicellulosiruptor hydrothermalis (strain DSM 18901 / VKM B-2411 / 108) TaxID=632292 RepID=E4Q8R6_CALH1|nr:MBL fold metallo-hydrolase [Caldicellulosiruptor hydrothermalis]ADQ08040.1 beta-lactamase domain protein [Caldicellulosiruptor hydrothermalis 108]
MFVNHVVSEGIYHIEDPNGFGGVCATLIIGKEKALLFDTCYGLFNLKEHIRSITDLPVIVVCSHGHFDHVGGSYQFDQIYIHQEDVVLAQSHTSIDKKRLAISQAKEKGLFLEDYDLDKFLNSKLPTLNVIEEEICFDLGDRRIKVIHLPGHTKGSIGIIDEKSRILFAGDAVSPFIWIFGEEATKLSEYIETLKKLKEFDFYIFYIAHSIYPFPKNKIDKLLHCAENVDISKSVYFSVPFIPEKQLLMYSEGEGDIGNPDYCAIVYEPEKFA